MNKDERIEVVQISRKLDKLNYTIQNLAVVFAFNGVILLIAFFR